MSQWESIKGFFRNITRKEMIEDARRVGWDGKEYGYVDESVGFKKDPRK